MQTEEHSNFRLNGHAVMIIAIVLIALALPVSMVIVALKPAKEAGTPAAAAEPLEKALAEIVDKNLAPSDLETRESRITFTSQNPAVAAAHLEKIANELDGIGLPPTPDEKGMRLTVAVPADRVDDFLKACQGKDVKSTIRKDGDARILITVVISSETP